jgi:phage terminase large subunit-like protein
VDTLVTSTAARRQPLVIYATTADVQRESVCNTLYDRACAVRDGKIRDSAFLPVIYEAPQDADWTDPAVWAVANPNLGVSVKPEYLAREVEKAKLLPSYAYTFRRLHLNQRTGSAVQWISADHWDACNRGPMPDLTGRTAYGGMDLSSTLDLSAVLLAIEPEDETEPIWLVPRLLLPEAKLSDKQDKVPYRAWADAGLLHVTPGEVIDYGFIRAEVNRLANQYDLRELRFDPWHGTQLATQLTEDDGLPLKGMRQGYASMSAPTKALERLIVSRGIAHDGNPVLSWQLSGCMLTRDASDNVKVNKQKSTRRVDGIIAGIMAVSALLDAPASVSTYQTHGLLAL